MTIYQNSLTLGVAEKLFNNNKRGRDIVAQLLAGGQVETARVYVRLEVDTRYTCKYLGKDDKGRPNRAVSFEEAAEYYRLLGLPLERLLQLTERKKRDVGKVVNFHNTLDIPPRGPVKLKMVK